MKPIYNVHSDKFFCNLSFKESSQVVLALDYILLPHPILKVAVTSDIL